VPQATVSDGVRGCTIWIITSRNGLWSLWERSLLRVLPAPARTWLIAPDLRFGDSGCSDTSLRLLAEFGRLAFASLLFADIGQPFEHIKAIPEAWPRAAALQMAAKDQYDDPVSGVTATFSAPSSGANAVLLVPRTLHAAQRFPYK